jgi:hypothetical protein
MKTILTTALASIIATSAIAGGWCEPTPEPEPAADNTSDYDNPPLHGHVLVGGTFYDCTHNNRHVSAEIAALIATGCQPKT